jgi:hypothetical protein
MQIMYIIMQQEPLKYVVKYVDPLKYATSHKSNINFASNLYLQSFGTTIDFFMHNTQLEYFSYFLGSLIFFYRIEFVCSLKTFFCITRCHWCIF